IKFNVLTWMAYNRQYQVGLEQCDRYLEQFPDFILLHGGRGWLLERLGRYPDAIAESLAVRAKLGSSPYFLGQVGFIYARSGDAASARKILADLEEWKKKGYAVCTDIAQVHVGLHDFDHALDAFDEALTSGEPLTDMLVDPTLDEIRPIPRFQILLQKLGLKK